MRRQEKAWRMGLWDEERQMVQTGQGAGSSASVQQGPKLSCNNQTDRSQRRRQRVVGGRSWTGER